MYAIIRDRSRCLTLEPDQELWIDRLPGAQAGDEHVFDEVSLLKGADGAVQVGSPDVAGAAVVAEVMGEELDEKLHVATFKRRKSCKRRQGHRQRYTRIRVKEIRA